ncbi:MAG: hypothetical protein AM1032_000112 [Mycoplasmataceae bacterium]|nr:MAG: hypothetical protein AM1032_000112 [Mycoplasmataceae bacterium]
MKNLQDYFTEKTKKPDWLNINSPQISNYDLIVGWDTEYQQIPNEKLVNPISYQYSAYHLSSDSFQEGVIYAQKLTKILNKRSYENLTLSQILKKIIQNLDLEISYLKSNNLKVLLIAHYSVAEFSLLKDREELIPYLTEVRNTLCSFKSFKQKILWDEINSFEVEITWRDTFLFALDNRSKSLAEVSKLTGCEKLDLRSESHGIKIDIAKLRETLLEVNKPLFEKYGIVDARISLDYYCKYISSFYEISKSKEEPLTAADLAVKFFVQESEKNNLDLNFQEKDIILKNILGLEGNKISKKLLNNLKNYRRSDSLVNEYFKSLSYIGNINTSYKIGESKNSDNLILECDFSQFHKSILSIIPIIDWSKSTIKNLSFQEIKEFKFNFDKDYCKIAFFKVKFKYPKKVFQCSLPVYTKEGLIYPLEGISFCNYYELNEAISQGCEILTSESILFNPLITNNEVQSFSKFLKFLSDKRKEYNIDSNNENYKSENKFCNLLLEIIADNFHNKLEKGVFESVAFDLKNKRESLKPSQLIIPHYIAMENAIFRTLMISILNELENTKNCQVLDSTKNSLIISLPKPENFKEEFWSGKKSDVLKSQSFQDLWPEIYEKLKDLPIVKLLMIGQKKLCLNENSLLKIKYIGDEAYIWKTKASYLNYKGKLQTMSRFSIPFYLTRNSEEMREFDKDLSKKKENFIDKKTSELKQFRKIEKIVLTNFKDIKKDKVDIVAKFNKFGDKNEKKVILDYDWKRILNEDGSTRSPLNLEEWSKYRNNRDLLHKKDFKSSFESMELLIGIGRFEKNINQTILKVFMSAYFQLEWKPKSQQYSEIVEILEKWRIKNYPNISEVKLNTLKSWSKRKFILNCFPRSENIKNQINSVIKSLNITWNKDKENLIFRLIYS